MTLSDSPLPVSALPRGLAVPPFRQSVYLARRPGGDWQVWLRDAGRLVRARGSDPELRQWAQAQDSGLAQHVEDWLTRPAPTRFAGLALDRPLLMGVVNVTPDSFSDGGMTETSEAAIARGRALAEQGADIIDVGGESTRPGADPVPVAQEIERIRPVVAALAGDGLLVSIDTRHAPVMQAALAAGARIINDVTALSGDPDSLSLAAASNAAIILMHMQGQPRDMQRKPHYHFAPLDVFDALSERVAACCAAGISSARLCLDPGIGFGKTVAHNCQLLAHLPLLHGLGLPLLLGVSRKSFIAALSRGEAVDRRLPGSLAAALAGLQRGVQILRVHDIAETSQAVSVWRAIQLATPAECG